MSRRKLAIPEVEPVPQIPEVTEFEERRGRKRLDPEIPEGLVMTFRAPGALDRLARAIARERDEPLAAVLRRACEIGLRSLRHPATLTRPGKF